MADETTVADHPVASPPRPALGKPAGAVFGTGARAHTPEHFGNPLAEQNRLRAGALVDMSHLAVLTVTGPDRLSWLNNLSSQKLLGLAPGTSTETLFLDPHGHIQHWAKLVDDGTRTWLLLEHGPAELAAFLDSMRFMLRVEVADVSGEFSVLGSTDAALLPEGEGVVWTDPWPNVSPGGASYAVDPGEDGPEDWAWTLAVRPVETARQALAAANRVAGSSAYDALRVAAWRPDEADIDHRTLAAEVDAARTAVHLAKGCYRGQEAVARLHNLGQPPRRLVFLHLDGSGHILPRAGAEVSAELRGKRRPVGELTSVAIHTELGPIGLAVIKRAVEPGAPLEVALEESEELVAAEQTEIVASARRAPAASGPTRNPEVDARRR